MTLKQWNPGGWFSLMPCWAWPSAQCDAGLSLTWLLVWPLRQMHGKQHVSVRVTTGTNMQSKTGKYKTTSKHYQWLHTLWRKVSFSVSWKYWDFRFMNEQFCFCFVWNFIHQNMSTLVAEKNHKWGWSLIRVVCFVTCWFNTKSVLEHTSLHNNSVVLEASNKST